MKYIETQPGSPYFEGGAAWEEYHRVQNMNKFSELQKQTGASNQGLANLLGVRVDTIKNWKYDRAAVPERVMLQMEQYAKAAQIIFLQK